MESNDIIFEELTNQTGDLGVITLNRPQALNALSHHMINSLYQQLVTWEQNPKIKAVVIQAAPGRAFCAGGDIRYVYEHGKAQDSTLSMLFHDEYRLNKCIYHYKKPYIALLNGITMGGGAGISLHGSHRIATENLVFAMPETSIGFFPDVGGSYFLPRLPNKIGYYLGLTGARITAADCMALGLTNYFVAADVFPKIIQALLATSLKEDAKSVVSKILIQLDKTPDHATLLEHKEKIARCFSKQTIEEIVHCLEISPEEWCQQTATLLKTKSPTSLKVTLRALQEGEKLDFDACLNMEYRLTRRFLQGHDFYEGVRALIIDKDQSPHWQPAEIKEVTQQDIAQYFAPLEQELV